MIVVAQKVSFAKVEVEGKIVGKIEKGLVLLIGIAETDSEADVNFVADKCANLRIFQDKEGKLNLSVRDINGEILAISQFTLLGDTKKGRRPNFTAAAGPEKGKLFYGQFIQVLKKLGLHVEQGIFGAMMDVHLVNSGPVTVIVNSK